MAGFHPEWQRVLANLRVQVWNAAVGEPDGSALKSACDEFVQFGIAYEAILNEIPTAMPIVLAFASALGSPNAAGQSAETWHTTLYDLIKKIDSGLQQSKEEEVKKSLTNKITINGGTVHSFQVGDNNSVVVRFVDSIEALIESAQCSNEHKQEARSILKKFIEHPLLNTVLGAGLGSIL